jgi:hypothetical protein
MPSLLDFPQEIFDEIIDQIPLQQLSPLLLVSRRLRCAVEPWFYSRIELAWVVAGTPPPIRLLLMTILSRPQLGNYVRCLVLKELKKRPWNRKRLPKLPADGPGSAEAIAAIESIDVPYREFWVQELRSGTMEAYIALLLSRLPELKEFSIDSNFVKGDQLAGLMLRSALGEAVHTDLPKFQHVQEVTWSSSMDLDTKDCSANTEDGLALFYLPNVRKIAARIENPASFAWPAGVPNPSNLTSLELKVAREPLLREILAVTRGLKSLRWQWFYQYSHGSHDPYHASPVIDLDQFLLAISQVRETLTELVISGGTDFGDCTNLNPPGLRIDGSLRGLDQFHQLSSFEAPLPVLLGSFASGDGMGLMGILPRALKYLRVSDDLVEGGTDHDIVRAVRPWLQDELWKQVTPELCSIALVMKKMAGISIEHQLYCVDWDMSVRDELGRLCAQAGVKYEEIMIEGWY